MTTPVVTRRADNPPAPRACGTLTGVHPAAAAELLSALTAAPDLPGAACVSERDVFDACLERGSGGRFYARAIRVCAGCPVLGACGAWVRSLPVRERPYGVTAGLIRRHR
jgi:hypothetical protein